LASLIPVTAWSLTLSLTLTLTLPVCPYQFPLVPRALDQGGRVQGRGGCCKVN
jgi:hypothetical protein